MLTRNIFLAFSLFLANSVIWTAPVYSKGEESAQSVEIKRHFTDGDFGQLHYRIARPVSGDASKPPLLLFHPTPYSSQYFITLMKLMATDRIVVAIDTPGYGDSTRPEKPQSLEAYSKSLRPAIKAALPNVRQYDVAGYHTGSLIAAELAIIDPAVRRAILAGVPYYMPKIRTEKYKLYVKAGSIDKAGDHLKSKWNFATLAVPDGLSLKTAQENFGDSMQSYPYDWWAYHGVFSHEGEKRLPLVKQKSLLLAVSGSLASETKAAAKVMPKATYHLLSHIQHGLFGLHDQEFAKLARAFLDN